MKWYMVYWKKFTQVNIVILRCVSGKNTIMLSTLLPPVN